MPRTPRKKEIKKVEIIEDVKEPEPVAEHRNCLMHEKQSFSSHQPEPIVDQHPSTDEELEIPKKRTKQRSEKQLEQLRLAREKSLLNKEIRRKQKEEEEQKIKQELEIKKMLKEAAFKKLELSKGD